MMTSRAAIVCIVAATLFAAVCHPRVVYGNGGGGSIVSFDDLFYAGQWIAFVLAILALVVSITTIRSGNSSSVTIGTTVCALLLIAWNIAFGIPHRANQGAWPARELGIKAFLRGRNIEARLNAKPEKTTAQELAGSWRAHDGSIYSFSDTAITWTGPDSGSYSSAVCSAFELSYEIRDREALVDLGMVWSAHAGVVYNSTALNARIPVANVACGSERIVFTRATADEIWRWTNSMDANDFKDSSFILRRTNP